MAVFSPPRGLIIDLITPLKGDGEIDGRGLGKHLDRVIPWAQALFLAGPYMGEGTGLNTEQRAQFLDKTIVVVKGRLPIMVWISQTTAEHSLETLTLLEKRLEARNYSGPVFWVDTPLYYHSNRGLPIHYREMSSLTKYPLILHKDGGCSSAKRFHLVGEIIVTVDHIVPDHEFIVHDPELVTPVFQQILKNP